MAGGGNDNLTADSIARGGVVQLVNQLERRYGKDVLSANLTTLEIVVTILDLSLTLSQRGL